MALVGIPTIAISELHAQLSRCQSEERWLRLNLEFGVKSKQLQSDVDIESLRFGARLNQLLVDEKQAFNVFSVSTAVSKKKQSQSLRVVSLDQ